MAADGRPDNGPRARERFERRLAERLDEGRLAEDVRCGDVSRDAVVRDGADELDAGPAFQLPAKRSDADERQGPLAEALERAREADDVLSLGERADAGEPRAGAVPAGERPEALQVDAAVHHLGLSPRPRHGRLE